ncbi:hypothetical protein [Larkinella sp. C7]|uniref:hypothetical protein n=1 Tax=Larkinella sp. C7 TaxID=2576607 RepID=UPI0014866F82|nr:hypothetical protein [Larkinella sp. C7]
MAALIFLASAGAFYLEKPLLKNASVKEQIRISIGERLPRVQGFNGLRLKLVELDRPRG